MWVQVAYTEILKLIWNLCQVWLFIFFFFFLIWLREIWKWLCFGSLTPSSHTTRILSRMHLAPYLPWNLGEIFLWSSSKAEGAHMAPFTPLGKKEGMQTTCAGCFLGWLQNTHFTWALAPYAKKILPSQSLFLDRLWHILHLFLSSLPTSYERA